MLVIPSIDVEKGRSRIVFWPGVSTGIGAPSDRPDRIAEHFVALGAPLIHIVDFDGARNGAPVNVEVIGAIASRVATPLQLAGGLDSPEAIRIAFAAGATRVVTTLAVADDPTLLRGCLDVAGDWLAVGLDARADRLAAFRWHRSAPPTLAGLLSELAGRGVRRFV
ncbi:MAG: phosphoribosylformimino-5-aminoimidazole carboxamide ribotide isomerase, partial [Chloroflexota bacterium]|nr:phosphoribosylformimino-5-aminoimidazole carboxamide ribotide isomerase [Chloroflexota bacterium]